MRKSKKLKDGDLRPRKRQRKSLGGRWIKMGLEIENYFGRRWVRRMEERWNVEDINGTGKIEARRIWKTCFEDLYNIDTQEHLSFPSSYLAPNLSFQGASFHWTAVFTWSFHHTLICFFPPTLTEIHTSLHFEPLPVLPAPTYARHYFLHLILLSSFRNN